MGLIGFGTVGEGVVRALLTREKFLEQKVGAGLILKAVCDKDIRRPREIKVKSGILTTDINKILNDPDIRIVIELIGGIHPARNLF